MDTRRLGAADLDLTVIGLGTWQFGGRWGGAEDRDSEAACHAALVSFASAGRMTCSPGMARRVATCSTGWCVGPSSPTPTESCVNTNTTLAPLRAASRTGGRM